MKGKLFLGALLMSAVLASQGFGAGLLGQNCGGCGACGACDPAACEPAACAPDCSQPCCRPVCDLFSGLKGLFACNPCGQACGQPACCEPVEVCAPEPQVCEPACGPACGQPGCGPIAQLVNRARCGVQRCGQAGCCEPAACEPAACQPAACQPACNACCRTPLLDMLDNLLGGCRPRCGTLRCGAPGCCETAWGGAVDNGKPAPAVAPPEEAAPLPVPPKADSSAALMRSGGMYQVSRRIVRY